MKFKLVILALLCIGLPSACSLKMTTWKLTEEDNNKQITIQKGDRLEVKLEANITTGYQWEWVDDNSGILSLDGEPEYITENIEGLVGAGGVSVLKFNTVEAGDGTLHLIYHRSFEEGVAPIEEFTVAIKVE